MDSTLDLSNGSINLASPTFPVPLSDYLSFVIQSQAKFPEPFQQKFHVIPDTTFLDNFSSDRSHMLDASGQYQMPPPDYPCIQNGTETMNLDQFRYFSNTDTITKFGEILSREEFIAKFL